MSMGVGSGQVACPPVLRARPLTCHASSSCVSSTFWRMARSSSRDRESRSRETRLSSSDSFRALRIKEVENLVQRVLDLGEREAEASESR